MPLPYHPFVASRLLLYLLLLLLYNPDLLLLLLFLLLPGNLVLLLLLLGNLPWVVVHSVLVAPQHLGMEGPLGAAAGRGETLWGGVVLSKDHQNSAHNSAAADGWDEKGGFVHGCCLEQVNWVDLAAAAAAAWVGREEEEVARRAYLEVEDRAYPEEGAAAGS